MPGRKRRELFGLRTGLTRGSSLCTKADWQGENKMNANKFAVGLCGLALWTSAPAYSQQTTVPRGGRQARSKVPAPPQRRGSDRWHRPHNARTGCAGNRYPDPNPTTLHPGQVHRSIFVACFVFKHGNAAEVWPPRSTWPPNAATKPFYVELRFTHSAMSISRTGDSSKPESCWAYLSASAQA